MGGKAGMGVRFWFGGFWAGLLGVGRENGVGLVGGDGWDGGLMEGVGMVVFRIPVRDEVVITLKIRYRM